MLQLRKNPCINFEKSIVTACRSIVAKRMQLRAILPRVTMSFDELIQTMQLRVDMLIQIHIGIQSRRQMSRHKVTNNSDAYISH